MKTKRTIAWALIVLTVFSACDNDKMTNNGDENNDDAQKITIQDLAGTWHMNVGNLELITEDSLFYKPDGSYMNTYSLSYYEEGQKKIFYQLCEEGQMQLDGNISYRIVDYYKNRYATTYDDINLERWDTIDEDIPSDTIRISLLYNGSVMLNEYFYEGKANPESKDVKNTDIYFRKGATNLPDNKSEIQGTWYYYGKSDTVNVALRFDADTIDFVITAWDLQRYKGVYTYKDGIVSVNSLTLYAIQKYGIDDHFDYDPSDPFAAEWYTNGDSFEYIGRNRYEYGLSFPFIVDDEVAYTDECDLDSHCPIFVKKR